MASYQVRQRDPLLDQNTQAMLERRGRELIGVAMLALAVVFVAMLGSYSATDPGWMVATNEPVNNMLGRFGASAASTLFIIGGLGAWGIPVILAVWGARFIVHIGEDRALNRVVFAVIAVALGSVFASTHVPGPDWPHVAIGLGGLFGDTVLAAMLAILPIGAGLGLKLLSVVIGVALVGMGLFVTGFDLRELRRVLRFLILGCVAVYAGLVGLVGLSASAVVGLQDRKRNRREMAQAAQTDSHRAGPLTPDMAPAPLRANGSVGVGYGRPVALRGAALAENGSDDDDLIDASEQPREKIGLLARMPQLIRRAAAAAEPEALHAVPAGNEDRIKARINDVIRSRVRQSPPLQAAPQTPLQAAIARREPPLNRRGPAPLVATRRPPEAQETGVKPPISAPSGLAQAPGAVGKLVVTSATRTAATSAIPAPPPTLGMSSEEEDDAAWACAADEFGTQNTFGPAVADADASKALGDYQALPPVRVSAPVLRPPVPETRRVVQNVARKPAAPSRQAMAEAQPHLRFEDSQQAYELPPLGLLASPDTVQRHTLSEEALEENARMLESVLDDYGVKGEIVAVRPGPVVTQYELEPAPGLKASRVIGLADDIARSMSALSARVSTVPGRSVIGIELPNAWREKVVLREILSARDFGDSNMRLPLALGKDIAGEPIVANLAKMPHLLIAGTTGSGKSVAINTMILSLLYKLSPEECRLIMIDPKMLELSVYDGIPHLLSPVVTDPKKAVVALKWVVGEMEERYRKMSKMGVRNIEGYNGRVHETLAKGEMFQRTIQTGFDDDTGEPVFETEEFAPVSLPYIVVVVDEMADLMMVAGKEIEACIQRLAQMARASGIHLIMATQRPSVDVITGTIKANFPTRISFQVTSKIDSRTILGEMGAEQLLGMGDMLYMAGGAKITRIHGPFVSDEEVEEIVNHLKSYGPPSYMSGVVEGVDEDKEGDIDLVLGLGGNTDGEDSLYDQAVAIVAKDRKCSTSYIQRKLGIGYNKAAKLVEQMEDNQIITSANHVGKREVLLPEH